MARKIERIALRLMKALKKEYAREPDATKVRSICEIASKICKSQDEFDRMMTYIGPKRMALINSWRRDGKLVAQPNEAGFAWIDSHKEKWPPAARVALIALFFSVLITITGLLVKWLER